MHLPKYIHLNVISLDLRSVKNDLTDICQGLQKMIINKVQNKIFSINTNITKSIKQSLN